MDAKDVKEGETLHYRARVHEGKAKVTQVYTDKRDTYWVALHDKARNRAVTVRLSQVSRRPFKTPRA
jgi:hypothetical protein